jgi:hypothetical protein
MEAALIAPCGMNCGICSGYLRDRKPCGGCSGSEKHKPEACRSCTVTVCEKRKAGKSGFCYECESYPCLRIKQLDKRYRAKYHMSMMENLALIEEQGMAALLARETEKWKCPECGGVICCHNGVCYTCLKQKPKPKWKKIPADKVTEVDLIAPCGMNCGVCQSYLALKNDVKSRGVKTTYCRGCLPRGKGCTKNKSGDCEKLMTLSVRFCYECDDFPCGANQHWDAIYQERYHTSPLANLKYIKANGMEKFLEQQREKWKCPQCGGVISCHNGVCYTCGPAWLKK